MQEPKDARPLANQHAELALCDVDDLVSYKVRVAGAKGQRVWIAQRLDDVSPQRCILNCRYITAGLRKEGHLSEYYSQMPIREGLSWLDDRGGYSTPRWVVC